MTATWQIRPAVFGDAENILTVSDEATVWLLEHGMSEQWGAEAPSSEPVFVARVSSWIRDGEAMVAKRAVEDAYYVYTVASRMRPESRGVGRSLIMWAVERARALGVTYLRLDCWAENAPLRAYYQNLGFEECDTYVDEGWPGAVMQLRV